MIKQKFFIIICILLLAVCVISLPVLAEDTNTSTENSETTTADTTTSTTTTEVVTGSGQTETTVGNEVALTTEAETTEEIVPEPTVTETAENNAVNTNYKQIPEGKGSLHSNKYPVFGSSSGILGEEEYRGYFVETDDHGENLIHIHKIGTRADGSSTTGDRRFLSYQKESFRSERYHHVKPGSSSSDSAFKAEEGSYTITTDETG